MKGAGRYGPRTYVYPAELLRDELAGMTMQEFYEGVKPGGKLHLAGFPAPVPWTTGRKKKYDREAVRLWRERITRATLDRRPVDAGRGDVVSFPGGGDRTLDHFAAIALDRAAD